ncbi:MAG: hypothetical protein HOP95_01825 [Sphingomonas sp.]|nr:hypothetical protein [Sphingomonas sp.]
MRDFAAHVLAAQGFAAQALAAHGLAVQPAGWACWLAAHRVCAMAGAAETAVASPPATMSREDNLTFFM